MKQLFSSVSLNVPELPILGHWKEALMNYDCVEYSLYDDQGRRKYLTTEERVVFYTMACREAPKQSLFALFLLFTGCRISEALEIDKTRIHPESNIIMIRTLKKHSGKKKRVVWKRISGLISLIYRGCKNSSQQPKKPKNHFRAVIVPPEFMKELVAYSNLQGHTERLWPIDRRTGYRWIKSVMKKAGIHGTHACPKGLRHGFANTCWEERVTPDALQTWMGHSSLSTTMIYSVAVGQEEYRMAARSWRRIFQIKEKSNSA